MSGWRGPHSNDNARQSHLKKIGQVAAGSATESASELSTPDLTHLVKRLVKLRRDREALFGPDLFAEPAWDILLDLLLAQITGRRVSVSSLCIAAAVPTTTALRVIQIMTARGLLERHPDTRDRRRHWIRLSPETFQYMESLLRQLAAPSGNEPDTRQPTKPDPKDDRIFRAAEQ